MIEIGQGGIVEPGRINIKCAAGEFVLILRPISEEDRLHDDGLANRYWTETDPTKAARLHVARELFFYGLIVGWEGVVAKPKAVDGQPTGEPDPVPFSREALMSLLSVRGVRNAIKDPIADYFNGLDQPSGE